MGSLLSRSLQGVSRRGIVLGAFLAWAMVLGGGGSPNPETEILVQIGFGLAVILWLWWASPDNDAPRIVLPRMALAAGIIVLALPLVQIVPLPPMLWHALPGREAEIQSLALVGQEQSWRALSVSPHLTLAALLAMIPAVSAFWAASMITQRDGQLVLAVISIVALAGAALGVLQMAGAPDSFRLYEKTHLGWLTAFHANRNAAADVLLCGMLALSGWFSLRRLRGLSDKPGTSLYVAAQFVLIVAVVMTGSRAGIALLILTVPIHWFILRPRRMEMRGKLALAGGGAIAIVLVALPLALSGNTRLAQVAQRFDATSDARFPLWQDSLEAIGAFWPVGSGVGSFTHAFAPFESAEHVDQFFPNRVHNDYLEFLLEAGLAAPILLILAMILLVMVFRRTGDAPAEGQTIHMVAFGILAIIALHSIVDYPLRNMAIACLAGVAAGLLPIGSPGRNKRTGKGREGER